MRESDWKNVKEIFLAASERSFEERAKFIAESCSEDIELKNEVESLLAAHDSDADFIETPAVDLSSILSNETTNGAGKTLGNYKIVREIGRGGMGAVFLAVRVDHEFHKRVAIKVLQRGMDTEDVLQRFRQERQILAALEHPFITRLLDGGMSKDGLPYFVMEYVEGEPLDKYCDEHRFSIEERLKLFCKVCSAIAYAHQNLVVHRDLKPSNILITKDGEPKLLDFGIAKFLNPELSSQTIAPTATFVRLMTPEYASPEQIRGRNISTASDIYSLGIILYKLLTGQNPYRFQNITPQEIERVVCETEPLRPSSCVLSDSQNSSTQTNEQATKDKGQRTNSLKGDLDNIILTALRKEPERRYKSVADFAEDIKRHLSGLPVSARPNTFRYRTEKFIRRNKIAVAAASLIFLAIVGGLVTSLWQAENIRRQRDLANAEKLKAERINKFLQQMLSFSNQSITSISPVAQNKNVTVNEMLDKIEPRVEAELADQPEVRSQILRTIGSAYASQGIYDKAEKNYRSALETQTQIFGEENAETVATMTELGVLTFRKLKFEEANQMLEKAVAFYQKKRRENAPEFSAAKLAWAMNSLGLVKFFLGDGKSAVSILNEALQIAVNANLQGSERIVLASIQTDLGGTLVRLGELERGETLLRESLVLHRQISERPRWEVGATLVMLGELSINKNQIDEAEKFLIESEQIYRQTLGDKNLYLAYNLQKQAVAFSLKRDFKTAEAKGREALAIYRELFPGKAIQMSLPMATLGIILAKDNRFGEGENYLREGLQGLEQSPVKNYLAIVQTKIALSEGLLIKNRLAESERFALEAHSEARQNLGEQSLYIKTVANDLIKIYERQGKSELAQKYK